jgi:anti-sigma B factor antagonist
MKGDPPGVSRRAGKLSDDRPKGKLALREAAAMCDEYAVHPDGDLDIATVGPLLEQWMAVIDEQQPRRFVFDMSAVTFLDSTGLAAIARVHNRQIQHGGDAAITKAPDRIVTVLRVTSMDRVLEVNGTKRTSHTT